MYLAEYQKARRLKTMIPPVRCSECNKKGKVHGHHPDYGKPLEIVWLCPSCHRYKHLTIKRKKVKTIVPYFQTTLEGSMFTAFQLYCTKLGCQTAAEGFRNMIRELPEFKELSASDPSTNNADSRDQNEKQS